MPYVVPLRNMYSVLGKGNADFRERNQAESLDDTLHASKVVKSKTKKRLPKRLPSSPLGIRARTGSMLLLEEALEFVEAVQTRRMSFCALAASEKKISRCRKRDAIANRAWPYVQKGIISGFIYMLGEAISHGFFSRSGRLGIYPEALIRTSVLHSTLIGIFANGPMLHFFFETIDRFVKYDSAVMTILIKVLIDQLVWGVLWNFSYILLMNMATDCPGFGLGMDFMLDLRKGWSSAFHKAADWRLHGQLLLEGLKMLPMDIICYWLVPLRLRALWVVSMDVFWVTILSRYD